MSEYIKQREMKLLEQIGISLRLVLVGSSYWMEGEKTDLPRDAYSVTITNRAGEEYRFEYTTSHRNSAPHKRVKPDTFDVLECLTIDDPGSFENFCCNYDYDSDSISALKVYNAVCEEWANIKRLFSEEELEPLREIEIE